MTISELTRDQLVELKQNYLTQHLLEVENRTPSYYELAISDEIVTDKTIFEAYEATIFSEDDFFCTMKSENNLLCKNCAYVGDCKSFPRPNNKIIRRYYCNCGDCDNYDKDITDKNILQCECFEEI